jgi:hypothetical protein
MAKDLLKRIAEEYCELSLAILELDEDRTDEELLVAVEAVFSVFQCNME